MSAEQQKRYKLLSDWDRERFDAHRRFLKDSESAKKEILVEHKECTCEQLDLDQNMIDDVKQDEGNDEDIEKLD